ncbi:hypothetical protein HBB16_16755 [Pseudonocardia sp. MCCB 268]|nr:hypothetical protein [Pseudonocardia cytotoxica]
MAGAGWNLLHEAGVDPRTLPAPPPSLASWPARRSGRRCWPGASPLFLLLMVAA